MGPFPPLLGDTTVMSYGLAVFVFFPKNRPNAPCFSLLSFLLGCLSCTDISAKFIVSLVAGLGSDLQVSFGCSGATRARSSASLRRFDPGSGLNTPTRPDRSRPTQPTALNAFAHANKFALSYACNVCVRDRRCARGHQGLRARCVPCRSSAFEALRLAF